MNNLGGGHEVWPMRDKYPEISQKITIRFNNRSHSQCFKCKFAWSDGYNTVVYNEEGNPLLVGNNCYEIIRDGWAL
jgi:hypothetical protein